MSEDRCAVLAEMAAFRREWLSGQWRDKPLVDLIQRCEWFEDNVVLYPHHRDTDIPIAEEMRTLIEEKERKLIREGMEANPIAFFRPSWTQAQKLNAWSPQFEPDRAPNGYRTVADFSAVRSGKTTADVISLGMWLFPNDPEWEMFRPYTDFKGRHVQVFRRPRWEWWQRTGKMEYTTDEPPMHSCENWYGCPDEDHWKSKVDRELRKWIPMWGIAHDGKTPRWFANDRWFETKWGSRVYGKLYNSDTSAWSGKELRVINFDEGPPRDKLEEARIRCAYINIAFTPREPVNTGQKTRVAKEIHDGKMKMPAPLRSFIFGWDDVPDHVMSEENKKMRRAQMTRGNEVDRVTEYGGFCFSSPVVFEAFARERHVLPVTGEQVIRAIRGECFAPDLEKHPWLEKFLDANVIRGFDEGTVHPSACVWNALLRTGEQVIFREYQQSVHSIRERAETIVRLSGNELVEVTRFNSHTMDERREVAVDEQRKRATGVDSKRYREIYKTLYIRKTLADSKLFKVDPQYPLEDFGANYHRAGLKIEPATNALPQTRCDWTNALFKPDRTRTHLCPQLDTPDDPHGYGLYITKDCPLLIERLECYLWGQIINGPRVGEFTGKPELFDDDLPDAATYATNAKVRWMSPQDLKSRGAQVAAA